LARARAVEAGYNSGGLTAERRRSRLPRFRAELLHRKGLRYNQACGAVILVPSTTNPRDHSARGADGVQFVDPSQIALQMACSAHTTSAVRSRRRLTSGCSAMSYNGGSSGQKPSCCGPSRCLRRSHRKSASPIRAIRLRSSAARCERHPAEIALRWLEPQRNAPDAGTEISLEVL